jgi:hypothetical protein
MPDITLDGCDRVNISAPTSSGGSETLVLFDGSSKCKLLGGSIVNCQEHAVMLVDSSDCTVQDVTIDGAGGNSNDTYDGVILSGDSDRNLISGIQVVARAVSPLTRYGINVSASTCDCNIVVGNVLGDPADYGTDALNDAGTDTQLFYPNDATYGDNFTACDPTS